MRLVPPCADKFVVVVLTNVPNVLTLQVMLVASRNSSRSDQGNVNSRDSTKGQLVIVVDSTNRPDAANVA